MLVLAIRVKRIWYYIKDKKHRCTRKIAIKGKDIQRRPYSPKVVKLQVKKEDRKKTILPIKKGST